MTVLFWSSFVFLPSSKVFVGFNVVVFISCESVTNAFLDLFFFGYLVHDGRESNIFTHF